MVFFRSGGDGGRGGAVVGVEHVGQAPQGGLGEVGVRRTATPRCSGRTEPIRGRADSLSGRTRGDVCSAPGLPVEPLDGVTAVGSWPGVRGEGGECGQVRLGRAYSGGGFEYVE